MLYAKLGRNAEALALFQEAVEDFPGYPEAYLNWGLVLASEGKVAPAKERLEKALQLSPNLSAARKALKMVDDAAKAQR